MLTLWGKGGYGGSPNVEAGKMYQQFRFDPELGSRGPNAAKNYLNHTPFEFRPL
jgi:hypothetical protein